MENDKKQILNLEEFVPSLRAELEAHPLDLEKVIRIAVPVKNPSEHPNPVVDQVDRSILYLTDGKDFCLWEAGSLQSLFRGDKPAPHFGDYPPEGYDRSFLLLELQVLEYSQVTHTPRDEEMKEIYSMLRRRPDGRSLGPLHDHVWRAAALMLGTRPLSKAEFDAMMSRLERSCRTFRMGPTSRNYVRSLQMTIGRALYPGGSGAVDNSIETDE